MADKKTEVLQAALDYWYVMDFLNQEAFPKGKSPKLNPDKETEQTQKSKARMQLVIDVTNQSGSLYDVIKESAKKYEMTRWGNISVYVGKIPRDMCIKKIAEIFHIEHECIEENNERLAWFSFQTEPDLQYIERSFSLSPVLWAVKQLQDYNGGADDISARLSISGYNGSYKQYNDDLALIEREGIVGKTKKKNLKKNEYELDNKGEYLEEYGYSVYLENIQEIREKIAKEYIRDIYQVYNDVIQKEKNIEPCVWLKFELYKDQKEWEKYDDDTDARLSRSYFLKDLEMVRDEAENLKYGSKMHEELADYIYGQYDQQAMEAKYSRLNMLDPGKDLRDFQVFYLDHLNPNKSPMGKWPSNYMPSFMQQVAINFAIEEGERAIFSVNGPPGTGKTTLLKEIVVHNVVERAKLLAEYERPDEAFWDHDYKQGSIRSTKGNYVYSWEAQQYHSFINDKINDYSTIVTSYNNAAVENISKEFPMEKGIADSLKPGKDNSEEMKKSLDEIRKLFAVQENEEAEWFKWAEKKKVEKRTKEKERDSHNIYFTAYAKELFKKPKEENNQKSQNEEVWGLISAPLGRKSYIHKFHWSVLNDLYYAISTDATQMKLRQQEYKEARQAFVDQWNKVKEMQKNLAQLVELEKQTEIQQLSIYLEEVRLLKEAYQEDLDKQKCQKAEIIALRNDKDNELEKAKSNYESICREIASKEKWYDRLEENKKQAIENRDRNSSVSILIKIFNHRKALETEQNYESANQEINRCLQEQMEIYQEMKELTEERSKAEKLCSDLAQELGKIKGEHSKLEEEIEVTQAFFSDYTEKFKILEREIKQKKNDYETKIEESNFLDDMTSFTWLDEKFINDLISKDDKESGEAHVKNPWFTAAYNREREKLFYYALRLQEAFILASRKFKENIYGLMLYWQEKESDDKKRVEFKGEDKAAVIVLYQSLFLLVPVISTTFASLGNFFKDVGKDGIGTLIIDEAGQASPHAAVGGLYRSRKAIIVGDPKQIEPVVKDDLELIKQGYSKNELCRPYIQKNLSVQTFADQINSYGTCFELEGGQSEWVGCPLVVHRRCIDPMFRISNQLSYGGIMKKATNAPKESVEKTFIYPESRWIQVKGTSKGKKNHFVLEQAECVIQLLEIAASKCMAANAEMSIYIISPFTSVKNEMKQSLKDFIKRRPDSKLHTIISDKWIESNIGTVHTFQGKEANEVIFLLGCDEKNTGAVNWVNHNIVNVAVTRAKYRLYAIGDAELWNESKSVEMVIGNLKKYQEIY